MKSTAFIYGLRRSHVLIFVAGFVVGISSFCLLDMRKLATHRILKQINVMDDMAEPESFEDEHEGGHHTGEGVIANEMAKKVRVYALILTMPASKLTKAVHVKATWARRFNGYMFISSEDDNNLPSVRAVTKEGREALWEKTRYAMLYAYTKHLNEFDFFMKADDDTYVIVENLRYLLLTHDPNQPILMGRRFAKFVKQGYASGGAGYVLSRAGLKLVAEGILQETTPCRKRGGAEDVNLGACAEAVGVKVVDSLDEHGLEVFHPFHPAYMLDKKSMDATSWVHSYNHFPIKTGLNCCSDHSVSFHYVNPKEMYALEYLIYHLYPYGITRDVGQCQKLLSLQQGVAVHSHNESIA